MHENDLSQAILVNVLNAAGGNQSISLESIKIFQISLISSHNYAISEILSGNEKSSPITRGQSNVFCLKSINHRSKCVNEDEEPSSKV